MITKKYLSDGLLQIAILLSLMKVDLNSWNSFISHPEIHEIVLGSSSAYTQTNFHSGIWNNHIGISHPKNLDNIYNSLLLHDLHSLGEIYRYDQVTTNIAWLGSPGPGSFSENQDLDNPVEEPGGQDSNNNLQDSGPSGNNQAEDQLVYENAHGPLESPFPAGDELTKEDLDLIDILWRQDMDLGVGREMFDMNLRLQQEKERETELQKQREKEEKACEEEKQESAPEPNITYIVDNETGEWVPAPPGVTGEPAALINSVNNTQPNGFNVDEMMKVLEDQISSASISTANLDTAALNNDHLQQQLNVLIQNNTNFNSNYQISNDVDYNPQQFPGTVPPVSDVGYDASQYVSPLPSAAATYEATQYQPPVTSPGNFVPQETATNNFENPLAIPPVSCSNIPPGGFQRSESFEQCLQEVADLFAQHGASPMGDAPSAADNFLFDNIQGTQTDLPSVNETLEGEMTSVTPLIRNTSLGMAPDVANTTLLNNSAMTLPPVNNSMDFTPSYNLNNGTDDLLTQMGMPPMNGLGSDGLTPPLYNSTSASTNDSTDLYNIPDPLFVLDELNNVPGSFHQMAGSMTSSAGITSPGESAAANMPPFTQTSSSEYVPSELSAFSDHQSSQSSPSSSAGMFSPPANMGTSHMYTSTSSFIEQLMDNDDAFEEMDFSDASVDEDLKLTQRVLDDASSDSALSSMGSISSPSQLHDINETSDFSDQSSHLDGLEGATGGHEFDHKYQKYQRNEPYRNFRGYHSRHPRLSSNHSDSGSSNSGYDNFADMKQVRHNHSYPLQPGQQPKERKVPSKFSDSKIYMPRDEKRIKALKIPFTMDEIIGSSVDHFNEMLTRGKLSEAQMQVMKDIRRRGKNKVAAQNCRKRKLDVITTLEEEVEKMRADRDKLLRQRRLIDKDVHETKEKMTQLYQEVFRSLRDDSGHPYDPNEYTLQQSEDGNVFLVPRNSTATTQDKKKGDKKRKGSKRAK